MWAESLGFSFSVCVYQASADPFKCGRLGKWIRVLVWCAIDIMVEKEVYILVSLSVGEACVLHRVGLLLICPLAQQSTVNIMWCNDVGRPEGMKNS